MFASRGRRTCPSSNGRTVCARSAAVRSLPSLARAPSRGTPDMRRKDAIQVLAEGRGGAVSVAIMQAMLPWHEAGQGDVDHIDCIGCMGTSMSLALGIALGKPDRTVMVLDGDGGLLMQLGSLVTAGSFACPNYYHFVFEN